MKKKFSLLTLVISVFFLLTIIQINVIMAAPFTPQGDIRLADTYNITNGLNASFRENVSARYFIGNGSFLVGIIATNATYDENNDSLTNFINSNNDSVNNYIVYYAGILNTAQNNYILDNNASINNYIVDTNATLATWVDQLFVRFTELVNNVGNWSLDKPSYVPYSGADTNLELGANNFSVDSNVLFVDSDNNRVGIGMIVPSQKLDVSGAIKASGTIYGDRADRFAFYAVSGGIYAAGSVDNYFGGNVGIGTADPQNTLNVVGTGNFTGDFIVDNYTLFVEADIDRIGIGTNDPKSILHVAGGDGIYISDSNTNFPTLSWTDDTGNSGAAMTFDYSNSYGLGTDVLVMDLQAASSFAITDDSGTKWNLFIQETTGYVGIGTINPKNKLNVNGTANITGTLWVAGVNISDNNISMNNWITENNNSVNNYILENNISVNNNIDSKLITTFFNATNVNPETGTPAGTVADLQLYDGVSYNVSEVSSDMELIVNFTSITEFNQIVVRYKSSSTENHVMVVYLWDYTTSGWESYLTIGNTENEYVVLETSVFDQAKHISGEVVQVRFYSNNPGGSTHLHQFDWVTISKGTATPSGDETDPFSIHTDGNVPLAANWAQGAFNLTNIESWFLGLIDWTQVRGLNTTIDSLISTNNDSVNNYIAENNASVNNWINENNESVSSTFTANNLSINNWIDENNVSVTNAIADIVAGSYEDAWINQTIAINISDANTSVTNYILENNASVNNYITSNNVSVNNWVTSLFVQISNIISLVGNWSADKGDYYTSAEVDTINDSVNNWITENNASVNNYILYNNDSVNNYILWVNSTNTDLSHAWINQTIAVNISLANTSMKNYVDSNPGGFITQLVNDGSPQLGGYLDTNGNNLGTTSDEIENIYMETNSRSYYGNAQEASIYYNGTALIIAG